MRTNRREAKSPWVVAFDPKEVVPDLEQRVVVLARTNRPKRMPTVRTPQDVAALVGGSASLDREAFYVLALGAEEKLIGIYTVSIGGTSMTIVEVGVLMRMLLVVQAKAVILVHNHPSGQPEPSREDDLLTQRILRAVAAFDVVVVDHVIFGRDGLFSFREAGLLPPERALVENPSREPVPYREAGERAAIITPNPEPVPYPEAGERAALITNPVTDDPLMPADTVKYELRTAIDGHGMLGYRIGSSRDGYFKVMLRFANVVAPGAYVVCGVNAKNVPVFLGSIYGDPHDVVAAALISGAVGLLVGMRGQIPLEYVDNETQILVEWSGQVAASARSIRLLGQLCNIRLLDFMVFVSEAEWGTRREYGYLSLLDYGMLPPEET